MLRSPSATFAGSHRNLRLRGAASCTQGLRPCVPTIAQWLASGDARQNPDGNRRSVPLSQHLDAAPRLLRKNSRARLDPWRRQRGGLWRVAAVRRDPRAPRHRCRQHQLPPRHLWLLRHAATLSRIARSSLRQLRPTRPTRSARLGAEETSRASVAIRIRSQSRAESSGALDICNLIAFHRWLLASFNAPFWRAALASTPSFRPPAKSRLPTRTSPITSVGRTSPHRSRNSAPCPHSNSSTRPLRR